MKKIPIALIYSRLLSGFVMLAMSLSSTRFPPALYVVLFAYGLLSDVLDGIIARRLGVSTEKMRRMDSSVDNIFYMCVIASVFILNPDFMYTNAAALIILVSAEAIVYIVSYAKFGREVATHALASKFWSLILFATLTSLMLEYDTTFLFQLCFYVGLITRLEILVILVLLKKWTADVPSFYHAIRLRQGREIKRNKYFNG